MAQTELEFRDLMTVCEKKMSQDSERKFSLSICNIRLGLGTWQASNFPIGQMEN